MGYSWCVTGRPEGSMKAPHLGAPPRAPQRLGYRLCLPLRAPSSACARRVPRGPGSLGREDGALGRVWGRLARAQWLPGAGAGLEVLTGDASRAPSLEMKTAPSHSRRQGRPCCVGETSCPEVVAGPRARGRPRVFPAAAPSRFPPGTASAAPSRLPGRLQSLLPQDWLRPRPSSAQSLSRWRLRPRVVLTGE